MRSAECKWRVEAASEARAAIPHSAFRIPHSVWWGVGLRILLAGGGTGGHLMPALALAQALQQARPDLEPVLVGAARGIEAQVLPRYPFRHHLLPMEPIYRRTWWNNVRSLLTAGRAWRAVGRVLDAEQPVIVLGTGGYAAAPVVWRAQRRGLPTVLQEQNAFPGLATRWLARGARQIHLGFPEARPRLSPGPTTVVFALGNPIRPPVPGDPVAARRAFAAAGAAVHLPERELDANRLARGLRDLLGDRARLESLAAAARGRGHPDASRDVVSKILTLVP